MNEIVAMYLRDYFLKKFGTDDLEAENNMHARSLAGRRRRRNKNST
jgi:hypothetical protein